MAIHFFLCIVLVIVALNKVDCVLPYDVERGVVYDGGLHPEVMARSVVSKQVFGSFTEDGFRKIKTPQEVQKLLKEFLFECCPNPAEKGCGVMEKDVSNVINSYDREEDGSRSRMCFVSKELQNQIGSVYLKIFQEWYEGDDELEISSVYGIRTYHSDATLQMHVDREKTHVISAILNVAQDLDEDWPLLITDFENTMHNVTLSAGDSVLYESMTLTHGRPYTLRGRYYSNIFIHSVRDMSFSVSHS